MRYTLNLVKNNITYKDGDSIIVSFSKPFLGVVSIDEVTFGWIPLDTLIDGHDVFIRWSYDVAQLDRATGKPHVVWSAWEIFSSGSVMNPLLPSIYKNMLSKPNLDIQFRFVRRGTTIGARRLENLILEITQNIPEEISENPLFPSQNSCTASACVTPNFSSGIILNCDPSSLFRPYDVMAPGIQLWKDISNSVSEMFGHCVRYFKTQAVLESADTVLKEYSLFNVTDVKDIKILIPGNEIPDNAIKFSPFDMDFGDGLEVHIVKEHFERAFGCDDLPEQKDYLYFPLYDRFYEVHSAYLYRDFMGAEAYYKVMLFKWQDKENVMRENPEIEKWVDEHFLDFDEVLQPEIDKEFVDITNPQQYTTTAINGYDKVRSTINSELVIRTEDLSNYFTIVAKYFYDMGTSMNWGDPAVTYKLKVDRRKDQNTAFTMWFKTIKSDYTVSNTYDILLEGYNDTNNTGYRLTLDYGAGTTSGSAITKSITLKLNGETHIFEIPQLVPQTWYGLVINHLNDYSQVSLHLWGMKYNQSKPTQNRTTNLNLIYTGHQNTVPQSVCSGGFFDLRAGTYGLTNIRIFSESIEEEKQTKHIISNKK